jgi:hypothetical protein
VEEVAADNSEVREWKWNANGAKPESEFVETREELYFTNPLLSPDPQIRLLVDNYSLYFNKTMSTDTGEYSCIINDRHSPESIIDLLIQGKWRRYVSSPSLAH